MTTSCCQNQLTVDNLTFRRSLQSTVLLSGRITSFPCTRCSILSVSFCLRTVGCCLYHVKSCHLAVPSSTTSTTMRCQNSLSSEALMNSIGLTLSFHDLPKLSKYFNL